MAEIDSGLFQSAVTGLFVHSNRISSLEPQCRPEISRWFATSTPNVWSPFVSEILEEAAQVIGPTKFFELCYRSLNRQLPPLPATLFVAPEIDSFVRRWHAIEQLWKRASYTKFEVQGRFSVRITRVSSGSAKDSIEFSPFAYWALILAILARSGFHIQQVETLGPTGNLTLFSDGMLQREIVPHLLDIKSIECSWSGRNEIKDYQVMAPRGFGFNQLTESLTNHLTELIKVGFDSSTVDTVARHLGMSERSLQRRLTEIGFSFSALRRFVKIQSVCYYLRSSEFSLEHIAELTSYCDAPHLIRDFQRIVGISPSHYREISRL